MRFFLLKNRASWKKHLSSKGKHEKPRQPVDELLPKREKEPKIKPLSLKGAGTERNTLRNALPDVHSSKEELPLSQPNIQTFIHQRSLWPSGGE